MTGQKWLLALVIWLSVVLGVLVGHRVNAQAEQPPSRWWIGSTVLYKAGGTFAEVWVFDYQGVCLYMATTDIKGYVYGPVPSLVAIPKTQLKPGVGCQ